VESAAVGRKREMMISMYEKRLLERWRVIDVLISPLLGIDESQDDTVEDIDRKVQEPH
jgi:hypothetical protein